MLKIHKLHLSNFCQHEKLTLELGSGLIGLYGPNGSGKSNAFNLGAYAALTNDFSRHTQNREGCIRQGMPEDQKSFVRLSFSHDDVSGVITRGLYPKTLSKLKFGDGKSVTKAKEIQEWMEQTLGITKRIIEDYLFIRQGQLFKFIDSRQEERAKSFSRLCGTQYAEECWRLLGGFITADTESGTKVVDNIQELKESIREDVQRYKELREQIKDFDKNKLEKKLARMKQHRSLCQSIEIASIEKDAIVTSMQELLSEQEDISEELKNKRAKFKAIESDFNEADALLNQYSQDIEDLHLYDTMKRDLRVASNKVVQLQTTLNDCMNNAPEPPEQDPNYLWSQVITPVSQEMSQIGETIEALSSGEEGRCSLCQAETKDWNVSIEGLEKQLDTLKKKKAKYLKRYQEAKSQAQAVSEHETESRHLKRSLEEAEKNFTSLKNPDSEEFEWPECTVDELKAEMSNLRQVSQMGTALQSEITMLEQHLDTAKRNYGRKKHELTSVSDRLQDLLERVPKGQKTWGPKQDAAFESVSEKFRQLFKAQGEATALDKSIKKTKQQIASIQKHKKREERRNDWIAIAKSARDKLHRNVLPQRVHRQVLQSMLTYVNKGLEAFDAEFRVTVTDGPCFQAHFLDKPVVMPADGLSGGQKMTLALAYWPTVQRIFADKLGIMLLDEPTDGLDMANRQRARDVLTKAGLIAKQKGSQIVVISHDEVLLPAFDQVINFEELNG